MGGEGVGSWEWEVQGGRVPFMGARNCLVTMVRQMRVQRHGKAERSWNIQHQGHLPLQRVGDNKGALYVCYELFGHCMGATPCYVLLWSAIALM